jgi:hypothetical protein
MIFLIDLYPKNNFGHFWNQSKYLRLAFMQQSMKFTFINPTAHLAKLEDQDCNKLTSGEYINLDQSEFIHEKIIEIIRKDFEKNELKKAIIIFSWFPQFTNELIYEIEKLTDKVEITIGGISPQLSQVIYGEKTKFKLYAEELLENSSLNKFIWVWDNPKNYGPTLPNTEIRRLPEYQSFIEKDSDFKPKLEISFFGMLSPFRGLSEILIIALLNPSVKITIRGDGFAPWRIWRPFKFKFLRYRKWNNNPIVSFANNLVSIFLSLLVYLPNVRFINEPFATENELNYAISKSTAIFYAAKLPISSGISLKSLASGVPVIWIGSAGEAFEFLNKNCPIGKVRYFEIFKLNFIRNKIIEIQNIKPNVVFTWEDFIEEIIVLKRYI